MQVKEAMHAGVDWAEPDAPVSAVAQKMRDVDIGAVPVCEKDRRMVGMLSLGDISHAASQSLSSEVIKAVSDHHA